MPDRCRRDGATLRDARIHHNRGCQGRHAPLITHVLHLMSRPLAAVAAPDSGDRLYPGVSNRTLGLLALCMLFVWFGSLGARHLLPSDEGRYAEIAREMFASGDWVTIRYNGVKYFEKPPFHLWMTAIAYHLFGVGDWQARLWVAISGLLGAAATGWAARRWFGPTVGVTTLLVLLASPYWNMASHFNSLDISVAAALAGVLAGFLLAQHPENSPAARRNWMLLAWVSMGIAVLTKGLIGIALPGLVLTLYVIGTRDWSLLRRIHLVSGLAVMLAVVTPWFWLVSVRNPEFPSFFFIHEHWQRYTSTVHHRSGPLWYFVPLLLVGVFPWFAPAWRAMAQAWQKPPQQPFRPRLLLALWFLAIFVFFSLSGSKLPGYILPVFPALAILIALQVVQLSEKSWRRVLVFALVVALAGLVASPYAARLGADGAQRLAYGQFAVWIAAAFGLAVAGLCAALWLPWARPVPRGVLVLSVTLFVAVIVGSMGHEKLGRLRSGVDLVPAVSAVLKPDMPVYSVRMLDHTLPFYLGRTMTMVEGADELAFGVGQEPDKWVATLPAFVQLWSTGPRAMAIMSPANYEQLRGDNVRMFPVAQDRWRVVVTNFNWRSP